MILEKRVMYDHSIDQRGYKWSGKETLKSVSTTLLPEYVSNNLEKFNQWID